LAGHLWSSESTIKEIALIGLFASLWSLYCWDFLADECLTYNFYNVNRYFYNVTPLFYNVNTLFYYVNLKNYNQDSSTTENTRQATAGGAIYGLPDILLKENALIGAVRFALQPLLLGFASKHWTWSLK